MLTQAEYVEHFRDADDAPFFAKAARIATRAYDLGRLEVRSVLSMGGAEQWEVIERSADGTFLQRLCDVEDRHMGDEVVSMARRGLTRGHR